MAPFLVTMRSTPAVGVQIELTSLRRRVMVGDITINVSSVSNRVLNVHMQRFGGLPTLGLA